MSKVTKVEFVCEVCGKPSSKQLRSYRTPICKSCQCKVSASKVDKQAASNKRRETCLKKYGVPYVAQNLSVQEKMKRSCIEKYGKPSYVQTQHCQQRLKETNLEKYGVENPFTLFSAQDRFRQKARQTMREKYGVEYAMSCPKIKKKQVETMLERYGVATACQNSELNEKKKQTNFKRYGTRAFNVEASKQTFVSHYGVDWNSKSKEFKEAYSQTSTQNWGVDHPFKSNEVRDKAKRTMKQRYGVENGAFLKKKGFYYAYDEQRFDSMWELAYYIYQKEHGVQIDRNSTKFFVLSNNKRFYPDFVINGAQYVEIKSNFWKLKQDWKRKSEVCKQESILVIDDALIQQYLSYVKETHGVNFLRLTRTKDQK